MMKLALVLAAVLLSWSSLAQSKVSYRFEVSISDAWTDWEENIEELEAEGWQVEGDEYERVFIHSARDLSITELPIVLQIADFEIRITETARAHKVSLDYVYGDYDGGTSSSAYLFTGQANVLNLTGGAYASGAWSVDAKAIIWLKP